MAIHGFAIVALSVLARTMLPGVYEEGGTVAGLLTCAGTHPELTGVEFGGSRV